MSEAYAKLEALGEALIEKSAEPLTLAQGVDRVLKTAEGKRLYEAYRNENVPSSIAEIAESELMIEAARIARSGVEKSAAVAQAIERNPDLARAAGHAVVEKSAGSEAWAKIQQLAAGLVEKSDISNEQAIDKVLKSAEGKHLYGLYRDERASVL